MSVLRREPALIISLAATTIRIVCAFVFDLGTQQQSLLNALVAAAAGLIVAFLAHDGQPAGILGFVQALIALGVGYGLKVDPDSQALIMSTVGTAVAMFIRTQVTAPEPPKPVS